MHWFVCAVTALVAGDMAAENSDFAQVLAEEFGDGGMDFGAFAAQIKQEKDRKRARAARAGRNEA